MTGRTMMKAGRRIALAAGFSHCFACSEPQREAAATPAAAVREAPGADATPDAGPVRESDAAATEVEAIDLVWAGHRVFFDFVGRGDHQVVAYYDAARQMSVAHRARPSDNWRFHKLPSYLGWDSHNAVVVGIDEAGHLHVVGNVHNDPLVYFRSSNPWDVRSLKQVPVMAGAREEERLTYPHFFNDRTGRLYFKHRFGGSGNGVEIYNVYDADTQTWRRLHDGAFVDGEGERNGYFVGPTLGPDGLFHLAWVWRETPIASTNHDITYARSADLVSWEMSDGTPLALPIRLGTAEIAVPVGQNEGLLNGHTPIGFDAEGRPVISFQRYDDAGDTQLFVTRREGAGWRTVQVSDWTGSRVDLDRPGALPITVHVKEGAVFDDQGRLVVFATDRGTAYRYTLDPATLAVLAEEAGEPLPAAVRADNRPDEVPQYVVRLDGGNDAEHWMLAWEAMPPNQDKARRDVAPPSTLRVYHLTE